MSINQMVFIVKWNKTVALLKKHDKAQFQDFPKLSSNGVCCGLSFILADYVRDNNKDEFFNIFNMFVSCPQKNFITQY